VHLGALPGGRRVAAITLAAVLPEVHVVLLVTRQAVLLELHLIRWAAVARLAGELAVRAAERKPGLLAVVELPQLPAVLRVAGVAGDLLVLPGEGPRGVARVVEARRLPFLAAVADAAVLAEATGVRVLRLMAAEAVARQLVLQISRAVAVVAGDAVVHPLERETGLLEVIELRGLPALGDVALGALGAALAVVHVVRLVAGDALLGRVLVAVAEVTGRARRLGVLVAQRKGGLVVVVADVPPGALVVAGAAVAPQLALVRLLFSMTGDAFLLRVAKGLAGGVTALAHHVDVRAAQRIVGVLVIELLVAQLHDVGGAAEMLVVAGAALRDVDAGEAAVEVAVLVQIAGDLLVTVETQPRLLAAVAAVVAERARFLVFHVSRAQLARHEKRLRIHGLSVPPCQQSRQPSEYQQRVASSLPHGWRWSASIDVDGNHMNDRRDDHHEDQRYVQRMPQ